MLRIALRNQGVALRNVYFKVVSLPNNNYLLNADGGPGQVGSKLSVPNANLPGGNQLWDKNENLTQDFRVGLLSRSSFILQVDVYANKATVAAAAANGALESEERVGSYLVEVDPEAPVAPANVIYLPVVTK